MAETDNRETTREHDVYEMIENARSEVQKGMQEAEQEIQKKISLLKNIINQFLKEDILAQEIKKHVQDNRGEIKGGKRKEAGTIVRGLSKVFEMVNQIKAGQVQPEQVNVTEKSFAILKNIEEKIGRRITESSSPFLYPFVNKLLQKELSIQEIKSEFDEIREQLSPYNETIVKNLSEALIKTAEEGKLGMTKEEAEKEFNISEQGKQKGNFEAEREDVAKILNIPEHYIPTQKELEVAKALISPQLFTEFIKKVEKETKEKLQGAGLNEEQTQIEISKEIELKIVLFFDQIFRHLDIEKPTTYYSELAQKDPWSNFQLVFDRLQKHLIILADTLSQSEDKTIQEYLEKTTFWRLGELRTDEDRQYGENTQFIREKIRPYPVRGKSQLPEFVRYLSTIISQEREVREYLHNVRAMFFHPAGEHGFYGQLAGYAEKLRMADVDELLLIPDNDLFLEAYNLYSKLLEEEYAKYDWRHPASLFDPLFRDKNKIEEKVLNQLRVLHQSNQAKSENKFVEEWRLYRAVSMAVGASLGVFMNDVENAAYADPHLNPDGSPSYASYYRNDTTAISPLNPIIHDFFRWQAEGTLMALLPFLPVSGKLSAFWNHKDIFEEMKKFKQSFEKRSLKPLKDGRVRLIEIMNIGKVGSPLTRAGWRGFNAYFDWLVYKDKSTDKPDFLSSWKALENVGFEALFGFVVGQLKFDETKFPAAEREIFFGHIFGKYVQPVRGGSFDEYYKNLEERAKKHEEPDGSKVSTAGDVYKFEVLRALSGVLRARIPTKFLRLERGRLTEGGKGARLWDTTMKDSGITSIQEFDEAIVDICLAETLLRSDTSRQMIEWVNREENKNKNLYESEPYIKNYRLTKERLRELLGGKLKEERIARAEKVLEKILEKENDAYLLKFSQKLKQRASDFTRTDLPFSIAPEEFEMRFVNFRSAGARVLARALGDTAQAEQKIAGNLKNFFPMLKEVSIDGKRDFLPLVKVIGDIEGLLESMHGKEYAYQIAHHLSAVVISYFKRDTLTRFWLTKPFFMGQPQSLAAEFAGTLRGVWEWDARDVTHFINELERRHILPKEPYDLSKGDIYEKKRLKFLGVKFNTKVKRPPDVKYYGGLLRREFGGSPKHIIAELLGKYFPIFVAFVIWKFISKALEELEGKKK